MSRILFDTHSRVPALAFALSGTMALGCSGQEPQELIGTAAKALSAFPDLRVPTGVAMTVNTYGALVMSANKGDLALSVDLNDSLGINLLSGDLVMVYQAQGATMATTDDAGYGAVTDPGGAGLYEVFRIDSFNPIAGTIQISPGCGLRNSYKVAGKTQVVRVPRYHNVSLQGGVNGVAPGTLSGQPWNGATGGVVALRADTITMDGMIDATALGFRGGQPNLGTGLAAADQVEYRSAIVAVGAQKGESIAGSQSDYDAPGLGGRYGRGAPANGGGGGNNFNAGGGGGANAGDSSMYTGDGVMGNTAMFSAAWMLDPYFVAKNAFATSSGGGRGGYTYAATAQDPSLVPPGDARWGGNNHREHGGRGGHPLAPDVSSRLFFGGGGGGGDDDSRTGGAGGSGGGIALLSVRDSIHAAAGGCIVADGGGGGNSTADGAGGGGGGGSVVLGTPQVSGVAVSSLGGKGGNSVVGAVLGPGGAGGGGFVSLPMGSVVQPQVAGGASGVSTSPTLAAFPVNGATNGGAGVAKPYSGLLPVCLPADLSLTVSGQPSMVRVNMPVHYSATLLNHGPEDAEHVRVTIAVPPGTTVASDPAGEGWTCSRAADVYTCTLQTLAANTTAPLLNYVFAARPEAPVKIVSAVQASADNADPVMSDNSGSVSVDIDRTEIHGDGFGCSATGAGVATGGAGAGALWLLLGVGAALRRARRRDSAPQ